MISFYKADESPACPVSAGQGPVAKQSRYEEVLEDERMVRSGILNNDQARPDSDGLRVWILESGSIGVVDFRRNSVFNHFIDWFAGFSEGTSGFFIQGDDFRTAVFNDLHLFRDALV